MNKPDLVWAKHRWKVSVAALAYRMNNLELMSDWSYHNVCVHIARGGKDREVASLPREQSQVLNKVLRTLRSDGTKLTDIADQLHLRPDDVRAMFVGLVTAAVDGEGHHSTDASQRPNLRLVD